MSIFLKLGGRMLLVLPLLLAPVAADAHKNSRHSQNQRLHPDDTNEPDSGANVTNANRSADCQTPVASDNTHVVTRAEGGPILARITNQGGADHSSSDSYVIAEQNEVRIGFTTETNPNRVVLNPKVSPIRIGRENDLLTFGYFDALHGCQKRIYNDDARLGYAVMDGTAAGGTSGATSIDYYRSGTLSPQFTINSTGYGAQSTRESLRMFYRIHDDTEIESDETFTVVISDRSRETAKIDLTTMGGYDAASNTIRRQVVIVSDEQPELAFAPAPSGGYVFDESTGTAQVEVILRDPANPSTEVEVSGPITFTCTTSDGEAGSSDPSAVAGQDYTALSTETVTIPAGHITAGTDVYCTIPIAADGNFEPDEKFTVTLGTDQSERLPGANTTIVNAGTVFPFNHADVIVPVAKANGGATISSAAADTARVVTIRNSDPAPDFFGVSMTADGVGEAFEVEGVFNVTLRLPEPAALSEVQVSVKTAATTTSGVPQAAGTIDGERGDEPNEAPDYESKTETITFAVGEQEKTFSVVLLQDDLDEPDGETFRIVLEQQVGGRTLARSMHVTIQDGADKVLEVVSSHLVSRAEALLANQPRLTSLLSSSRDQESDFRLRVDDAGLRASGGFAREGFWASSGYSRIDSGEDSDSVHLTASLGSHARLSDDFLLGGMLQFDRTGTELDGGLGAGEISSTGWMAGPYIVGRDASRTMQFEGRLLYGRSSNDVEGYVAAGRSDARNGSFDSERWLAQARVEGRFPLGNGAFLVPLADVGHVRSSAESFDYEGGHRDPEETVRVAVSRLQLGTDFEIPVDTAEGDLVLKPGLSYVLSDRDGGEYGKSGRDSSGQIDFGVDYRLDGSVWLGFRGHYSGFGGSDDISSFGAGLDFQVEF